MTPACPNRRWLSILAIFTVAIAAARTAEPEKKDPAEPLALSAAERTWLAAHPVIRVGMDPAWPPFSAAEPHGQPVGIDPDLLARIGKQLGVRFEPSSKKTWGEVYDTALARGTDVLASTALTADRMKDFNFTAPYFSFPVVIVTRNDEPLLWSVVDLAGRRIVGVRGYAPTQELQREHPELAFEMVETTSQALRKVADGEADAFVSNLPNVSFVAKTRGLANLKVAGVLPMTFDLRYAVRPDWPELVTLLDRAIATLTEADRQAIVHPWIRVDYARVIRWDLVWKTSLAVLSVLAFIIGLIAYRNRLLGRELKERIRLQDEIKGAHDELVHLNEEKSELLQMAAHDLRGPLTGMQLAIDASLRLGAIPGPVALEMVEKQARQMTGLLNDLLDAEALEHGRREFRLERVKPETAVLDAIAGLTSAAQHKNITIQTSIAEALPLIEVDPTAWRQIADNLISNALKFSPLGATVAILLAQREGFVRMEVRDEGAGVRPGETERIFAKYARGSTRPTGDEKSTGLGLAIVRQLAGALNARVWCESAPVGGYFIVMIPVAKAGPVGLSS